MSDEDLFTKAMSVVRPIAKPDKVIPDKPKQKKELRLKPHSLSVSQPASHPHASLQQADEPWILKASGVSQEKLKQLGAGRPKIDIETDLHGMNREEALKTLEKLMHIALDDSLRVLCIVHGRGLHSQGRPVLKEAVYGWLRSGPFSSHILAAIPKPYTGGGSCLVLLRRNRLR
ncbi:MAG: Smr/MutS family protein [Mariprofundus sp.]